MGLPKGEKSENNFVSGFKFQVSRDLDSGFKRLMV